MATKSAQAIRSALVSALVSAVVRRTKFWI
jgi:hypothetical protein